MISASFKRARSLFPPIYYLSISFHCSNSRNQFPIIFCRNCEESPNEKEVHDPAWRERARP